MRALKHPHLRDVGVEHVLHALSDPIRLEIVRQIAREGECSCNAIDCGRAKSSMSHHFRVLRDSGVIRTRSDGTAHMNALRREELDARFPGLLSAVLAAAGATAPEGSPAG